MHAAIAQGYETKVVEKDLKTPNEYAVSNKNLYEYLMDNKDFTETIFGPKK